MSNPNGPVRRRRIAGEAAPAVEPAAKKTSAKKKPAAKAAETKAPAKKTSAKKTPAKKAATAKATTAKTTTKESTAKKATPAASPKPVSTKPAPTTKPAPVAIAKPLKTEAPKLESSTSTPKPAPTSSAWLIGAAVAMVLAIGFAGWFGVNGFNDVRGQRSGDTIASSNAKASDAAARAAETIFTYQYDKLSAHVTESKKLMTPAFQKQFDKISPALDELAPQNKIVVKGVAQDAAAVQCGDECSSDKASVLVFLDQARLVGNSKTPTVFGNRIIVDMVKRDGQWLVNNIEAL